jgi:hypothetical protein
MNVLLDIKNGDKRFKGKRKEAQRIYDEKCGKSEEKEERLLHDALVAREENVKRLTKINKKLLEELEERQ